MLGCCSTTLPIMDATRKVSKFYEVISDIGKKGETGRDYSKKGNKAGALQNCPYFIVKAKPRLCYRKGKPKQSLTD